MTVPAIPFMLSQAVIIIMLQIKKPLNFLEVNGKLNIISHFKICKSMITVP